MVEIKRLNTSSDKVEFALRINTKNLEAYDKLKIDLEFFNIESGFNKRRGNYYLNLNNLEEQNEDNLNKLKDLLKPYISDKLLIDIYIGFQTDNQISSFEIPLNIIKFSNDLQLLISVNFFN